MKKHEDKLWIATFRDATKYMRERMNANVDSKNQNGTISVTLTHKLDKELYNVPLTLKTYIDRTENIEVKQGDNKISFVTGKDENGNYILYQAVPNSDDIKIIKS